MLTLKAGRFALVVALVAACSPTAQRDPQVGPEARGLQVRIENETTVNLRVVARIGNNEMLLGRVDGGQHRSLRLPIGISGTLNLIARNRTSGNRGGHVSQPFTLSFGQWVTWRLRDSPGASDLPRLSTVHVFSCETAEDC